MNAFYSAQDHLALLPAIMLAMFGCATFLIGVLFPLPKHRKYLMAFALMAVSAATTAGSAYLLGEVINQAYVDRYVRGIALLSGVTVLIFMLKGAATYGHQVILLSHDQRTQFLGICDDAHLVIRQYKNDRVRPVDFEILAGLADMLQDGRIWMTVHLFKRQRCNNMLVIV